MKQKRDSHHILLIEDDLADAGLVKISLRRGKHDVTLDHAKDANEAFAYLRRIGAGAGAKRPDLILLDLNLPGRTGFEILQEIKADSDLRPIPVVILSTSEAERDILRAYAMGANSFITKPMDADAFASHIHILESYWFDVVNLPE